MLHLCALPHTAEAQQFAITSAQDEAYNTHALAAQRHAAFYEQLSSVSSELYGVCQTEVPACISDLRTLQERAASADAAQDEFEEVSLSLLSLDKAFSLSSLFLSHTFSLSLYRYLSV